MSTPLRKLMGVQHEQTYEESTVFFFSFQIGHITFKLAVLEFLYMILCSIKTDKWKWWRALFNISVLDSTLHKLVKSSLSLMWSYVWKMIVLVKLKFCFPNKTGEETATCFFKINLEHDGILHVLSCSIDAQITLKQL